MDLRTTSTTIGGVPTVAVDGVVATNTILAVVIAITPAAIAARRHTSNTLTLVVMSLMPEAGARVFDGTMSLARYTHVPHTDTGARRGHCPRRWCAGCPPTTRTTPRA